MWLDTGGSYWVASFFFLQRNSEEQQKHLCQIIKEKKKSFSFVAINHLTALKKRSQPNVNLKGWKDDQVRSVLFSLCHLQFDITNITSKKSLSVASIMALTLSPWCSAAPGVRLHWGAAGRLRWDLHSQYSRTQRHNWQSWAQFTKISPSFGISNYGSNWERVIPVMTFFFFFMTFF